MAEEAGDENFFLFGLTAEQVRELAGVVQPALALRTRAGNSPSPGPDSSGSLSRDEPGIFRRSGIP